MRKILLPALFILTVSLAHAQWASQATGFSTANRGINQIVAVSNDVVWATAYDGSGLGDTVQEYTVTTDGGTTWTPGIVDAAPTGYDWSCLTAIDDQTAWAMFYDAAAGSTGGIFKTTDGGSSWNQQSAGTIYSTAGASFPDVIHFWDANNGVAVGDPVGGEYEIYTTTDGGANWNAVSGANIPDPVAGEYGYTRVLSVYGNTIWFGTNKGRIYKSTDKGYNWTAATTGLSDCQYVEFKDGNTGWMKKPNLATLKKSTDGGATWASVSSTGTFFLDGLAYVPTTNTIVSIGVDYTTWDWGSSYSTDDGATWITIDSAVQHTAVDFWKYNRGWSGGFNLDQFTDGMFGWTGAFDSTITASNEPNTYQFNLYPNPSHGLFYISFGASNNEPIHISVMDISGKLVFDKTYADQSQLWLRSIDLRAATKGVYVLHLQNRGNELTRKLIVQ